jgi:hypothetical protein
MRLINGKFKKPFQIQNRMRFIFATNESWAINASGESRRYFVLKTSEARMQDNKYFGELVEYMRNGGTAALFQALLDEDISKFDPMRVPRTKALIEQRIQSVRASDRSTDEWVVSKIAMGEICGFPWSEKGTEPIVRREIYEEYMAFCEQTKKRYPDADYSFFTRIRHLGIVAGDSRVSTPGNKRAYACRLVPLSAARKKVSEALGIEIDQIPVADDESGDSEF